MHGTGRFTVAFFSAVAFLLCHNSAADDPELSFEETFKDLAAIRDLAGAEGLEGLKALADDSEESPDLDGLKDFDTDGDFMLSMEEILADNDHVHDEETRAFLKMQFDKHDLNKDGKLNLEELPAMMAEVQQIAGAEDDAPDPGAEL